LKRASSDIELVYFPNDHFHFVGFDMPSVMAKQRPIDDAAPLIRPLSDLATDVLVEQNQQSLNRRKPISLFV
jgi:hypothetical protein